MADKQALNATFFAFRKREKGGVLLSTSIAFFVAMLILVAIIGAVVWALLGSTFMELAQLGMAGGKGDPTSMPAGPPPGIFLIFPLELLFLVFYFILLAAYEAGCLRWMIRGEREGLFGLSLGADTWRVYGTYWAWLVFMIIGGIALSILFGVLAGLLAGVLGEAAWVGMTVIGVACLLAFIYFPVRLAPAAATSVGAGRFAFFSAWTVSRDRFWALFGSFLLLFVIYLVASIIITGTMFALLFGPVFASMDWTAMQSDPQAFSQAYLEAITQVFSTPASIALYIAMQVVSWVLALTFMVMTFGVNARAVQAALEEGKIAREAAA